MQAHLEFPDVNIPAIQNLSSISRWVLRDEDKRPLTVLGRAASVSNPSTWATFDSCVNSLRAGTGVGLGFVFIEADDLMGVDFDHCLDDFGRINDRRVEEIIRTLDSYTEVSPSGRGLHTLVRGRIPRGVNAGWIEMYPSGRYFTVTGNHHKPSPLEINSRPAAVAATFDIASAERNGRAPSTRADGVIPNGMRHDSLVKEATRLRREDGRTGASLRNSAIGFNLTRCDPPSPIEEVCRICDWVEEHVDNPPIMFEGRHQFSPRSLPLETFVQDSVTSSDATKQDPIAYALQLSRGSRNLFQKFNEIWLFRESRGLIEDVFDRESLVAIVGKPGSSKTFLALDMALAIARGVPWFGHSVRNAEMVVYVAAEGGGGINARIEAYRLKNGLHQEDLDFFLLPAPVSLLDEDGEMDDLIADIRDLEVRHGAACTAIFVDTLSMSMPGGDENASLAMTKAVDSARRLIRELGATVALIHHLGKDRGKGARGHSSLLGALDTELTVEGCANGFRMHATKQRDIETGAGHSYTLESVALGANADGKPMSSCVVVPASGSMPQEEKTIEGAQLEAYNCFKFLLDNQGEAIPPKVVEERYGPMDHKYRGARCISVKLVKDRFVRSRQEDADGRDIEADSSRRAFDRARSKLQERGLIELFGGVMWIPISAP